MGGNPILAAHSSILSLFQVKDTGADIGVFTLAHFSFTVNVPNRFSKSLQNIWSLAPKDVIHVVGRDNVGLSSFQGARDAQQAYDIRVVGMEILTLRKVSFQPIQVIMTEGQQELTVRWSYISELYRSASHPHPNPSHVQGHDLFHSD